jgi:hypothetical protein
MIQGCFVIGDSLQPKPPVALFTTPIAHLGEARNHYVPSKDGKRFLVLAEFRENANAPVNVVLNFPAAYSHRHKLPVGCDVEDLFPVAVPD